MTADQLLRPVTRQAVLERDRDMLNLVAAVARRARLVAEFESLAREEIAAAPEETRHWWESPI